MSVSNENICPICFDAFQEGQATLSHRPEGSRVTAAAAEALEASAASRPDEHKFHQDCLVTWLRSSFHCPVCRAAGDVFGAAHLIDTVENPNEALQMAAMSGNYPLISRLLTDQRLTDLAVGCALVETVRLPQPNMEIVNSLLLTGRVNQTLFRIALGQCGSQELRQALRQRSALVAHLR